MSAPNASLWYLPDSVQAKAQAALVPVKEQYPNPNDYFELKQILLFCGQCRKLTEHQIDTMRRVINELK